MSDFAEASSKLFLKPGAVEPGIEVLLSTSAHCKRDSLSPTLEKTIELHSSASGNTEEKRAELEEQWDDGGSPYSTKRLETETQWTVLSEASEIPSLLSVCDGSTYFLHKGHFFNQVFLEKVHVPSNVRYMLWPEALVS